MAFSLIWLPDVLQAAGLKVAKEFGWENRGIGDVEEILGVICHHTANPNNGNMPALGTIRDGRLPPDPKPLTGPLAQLGLGRDGTFYIIAAGKCNHAGAGEWKGLKKGNSNFIGIEAENKGTPADTWPDVQMDAYRRGVAAILKHIGQGAEFCVGHKEWAPTRKSDPLFDMNNFRASVAAILNGVTPPPTLIPPIEPPGSGRGMRRPTLRRGDRGEFVKQLQTKLSLQADGIFGANTEAKLRAFQRQSNLVPDGIVGPKTWVALDNAGG